jgi:hypothetical protein
VVRDIAIVLNVPIWPMRKSKDKDGGRGEVPIGEMEKVGRIE